MCSQIVDAEQLVVPDDDALVCDRVRKLRYARMQSRSWLNFPHVPYAGLECAEHKFLAVHYDLETIGSIALIAFAVEPEAAIFFAFERSLFVDRAANADVAFFAPLTIAILEFGDAMRLATRSTSTARAIFLELIGHETNPFVSPLL